MENQKQAAGCSDREVEQVGLEKTCFFAVGVEKSVFPGLGGNATLSLVSGDYESSWNLELWKQLKSWNEFEWTKICIELFEEHQVWFVALLGAGFNGCAWVMRRHLGEYKMGAKETLPLNWLIYWKGGHTFVHLISYYYDFYC